MQAPSITINRKNVSLWIVGTVAVLVLGMVIAGLDLWSQSFYYASTDNALVAGSYVQIGAPGPATVESLDVRVGEAVAPGQHVATLQVVGPASSTGVTGRVNVHLRSPRAGKVVSLPVQVGQNVDAGDSVVLLANPDELWVVANIDESALKGVRVGQAAEVQLNLLDRTVPGHVAEVLPVFVQSDASTTTAARANTVIPVKVELDGDRQDLYPGMSAYVKIRIR